MSKYPSGEAHKVLLYVKEFVVAKIKIIKKSVINSIRRSGLSKAFIKTLAKLQLNLEENELDRQITNPFRESHKQNCLHNLERNSNSFFAFSKE